MKFLEEIKKIGLERAILSASELATLLDVEPEFKSTKRLRYVKRHFDFESWRQIN